MGKVVGDVGYFESLNREMELQLWCARTKLDTSISDRIVDLLRGPLDWRVVLASVYRHGLIVPFYGALRSAAAGFIPEEIREDLRRLYGTTRLHNRVQVQQLLRLLEDLQRVDIEVLSFKGPTLAALAYKDPLGRWPGDLDLLIRPEDYQAARQRLAARGYEPRDAAGRHASYLRHRCAIPLRSSVPGSHDIDLHVTLSQKLFDGFPFSSKLDASDVWSHSQYVDVEGVNVRTLSSEDALLHLCSDGAKDNWSHLGKVCDLAELIGNNSIRWSEIRRRARATGVERIVRLGLALSDRLLSAPLPSEMRAWIGEDATVPRLVETVAGWMFDPEAAVHRRVGNPFSVSAAIHLFRANLLERPHEKALYSLYRGVRKVSKAVNALG